jgi:lysozyme
MTPKNLILIAVGALVVYSMYQDQDDDLIDTALTAVDELAGGTGINDTMQTSPAMLSMLKRRESLSLTRYALGDGGYTWGYGHFSRNPDALPATITRDQAESIFATDVRDRGEKWVKLYVSADLSQNEFDALVSIAFNMSPQSFKKFAAQVNAGNGIEDIAEESVSWVAPQFTNGIANRRAAEVAVFNEGTYA